MSETMRKMVECLQEAVELEMERKAKLGQKAVAADKNGDPKVVSAKYLLCKMRTEKAQAANCN